MKLSDFKVLTFDTYGTLIDWETGIFNGLAPLVEKAGLENRTRNQILETFAKHETDQEVQTPAMVYMQLLSVVYKRLANEFSSRQGIERDES